MTGHFKEIARQEEAAVAQYRKEKTGVDVNGKGRPGNNDLIVCDNMTIDNGKGSGALPALLAAVATGAGLWWAGLLELPTTSPTPITPTIATDTDTDTQYQIIPTEGR